MAVLEGGSWKKGKGNVWLIRVKRTATKKGGARPQVSFTAPRLTASIFKQQISQLAADDKTAADMLPKHFEAFKAFAARL